MDLAVIRDLVTIIVPIVAMGSVWGMVRVTIKRLENLPEVVACQGVQISNIEKSMGEVRYEVRETHNKTIELDMRVKALHQRIDK